MFSSVFSDPSSITSIEFSSSSNPCEKLKLELQSRFDALTTSLEIIENDIHDIEELMTSQINSLMSQVNLFLVELQELAISIGKISLDLQEAATDFTNPEKVSKYIELAQQLSSLFDRFNSLNLKVNELRQVIDEFLDNLSKLNEKIEKWIEDYVIFRLDDYISCFDNELNALWYRIRLIQSYYNILSNSIGLPPRTVNGKTIHEAIPKFDVAGANSKLKADIFDPAAQAFEDVKNHLNSFEKLVEILKNDDKFKGNDDAENIIKIYTSIKNNFKV